jgi:hypothetical protein
MGDHSTWLDRADLWIALEDAQIVSAAAHYSAFNHSHNDLRDMIGEAAILMLLEQFSEPQRFLKATAANSRDNLAPAAMYYIGRQTA